MRQSPVFSCPSGVYVRAVAKRLLRRWLWLPVLVTAGLAAAAFADIRFAYVLLMAVFVVYPMVLTMVWLSLTGSPHAVQALRPQRWTFGHGADNALTVEFFRFDPEEPENPGQAVATEAYAATDIERIDRSGGYTYVWLRRPSGALLAIPTAMTPTPA